jgi:glycosyltransferase involved in cell wall biosynthesis
MRIAIATVQVPFMHGGGQILCEGLRTAIAAAGHPVEVITLPFRFAPEKEVLRAMQVWREEDLTELNWQAPDLVIPLTFPAWGLDHPNKRAWVLHQYRAAYELFDPSQCSRDLQQAVGAFDRAALKDCAAVYTIARNVSRRMLEYTEVASTPLYHPPADEAEFYTGECWNYIFAPSRIESLKRQTLLLDAVAHMRSNVKIMFAGTGGQQQALQDAVVERRLSDRVRLLGHVTEAEKRALYAHALAVFFGPKDEDYGYVTLEAMLSAKPVITCTDSGGPLEFVEHDYTGEIVEPAAQAVAAAVDRLATNPVRAARLGQQAYERYRSLGLSWNKVVETLLFSTPVSGANPAFRSRI